ncbi:MAG: translation initiation factor 2 [Eubacteriales bacterium]|nr:translation initiation factor 2 [Eubacteriales bacterium]
MRGKHRVIVYTKRVRYDFELRRNITVIRGDSATGKTTLIDMVQEHINNPSGSPVEVICDKPCYVLAGALWKEQLSGVSDGIVFIDEGNEFVKTDEFSRTIQGTDNYYVIVTREGLSALPYSVEEIYGIRTSGKFGTLKQSYHEFYRIYGTDVAKSMVKPDIIITEDSNSGYQFFKQVSDENRMECYSAEGKSNIFRYLKGDTGKNMLIIADGAAFGSEIDRVLWMMKGRDNVAVYLPESFEWLILSSGIFGDKDLEDILNEPSDYVESKEYFSWERFFTALLVARSRDTYLTYSKRKMNHAYLSKNVKEKILARMEKITLN